MLVTPSPGREQCLSIPFILFAKSMSAAEKFQMDAALRRIGSVNIQSMPGESAFIKPYSIQYEMV